MLVYGSGKHLLEMLEWHPILQDKISRIFDRDGIGSVVEALQLTLESAELLTNFSSGTEIFISDVKHFNELADYMMDIPALGNR